MPSTRMPNFLVIGAGKSGTTSLDNYLNQHPEIFMSPLKEPNFFHYELTSEGDLGGDVDELRHFNESVTDLESYRALFDGAQTGQLIGETSNTYLYGSEAPERIKAHLPEVKMIAILREPVARLYSRYLHLERDEMVLEPFEKVTDKASVWWKRNDLIQEGFYHQHLSRFYELFDERQIKVYLFEDLMKNSQETIADMYRFLGVDDSFVPDTELKLNESGVIKNKFYDRLVGHNSVLKSGVKSLLPGVFMRVKSHKGVQKIYNKVKGRNLAKPKIDPELKTYLKSVYKEDVQALSILINRDLKHWLADGQK